ncbi:hypothetical protein GCM10029978_003440 [Actinoallomurus acanthiterrae]
MAGQPDVYVGVAQVEVGMMVHLVGYRADGAHDREPGREVLGVDAGLQSAEQVCPPVQRLVCDLLSGQLAHGTPLHLDPVLANAATSQRITRSATAARIGAVRGSR